MDSFGNVTHGECAERAARIVADVDSLQDRLANLEKRMAEKDCQFAVINTKLTAILWGIGAIATALIGVLVKFVFNF